eukprot:1147139-Pelagomonas_calceolata.AAC.7
MQAHPLQPIAKTTSPRCTRIVLNALLLLPSTHAVPSVKAVRATQHLGVSQNTVACSFSINPAPQTNPAADIASAVHCCKRAKHLPLERTQHAPITPVLPPHIT